MTTLPLPVVIAQTRAERRESESALETAESLKTLEPLFNRILEPKPEGESQDCQAGRVQMDKMKTPWRAFNDLCWPDPEADYD